MPTNVYTWDTEACLFIATCSTGTPTIKTIAKFHDLHACSI